MRFGFYPVLLVQFLSAMGDNALLFAAIAQLNTLGAPPWQTPVLQQGFVAAFILLAPFVGNLADRLLKGQVMALSNGLKAAACLAMVLGVHPLAGYMAVGVGAAIYSPAKYGILAELFPAARLVWANGWMEGVTVVATILGALAGGALVSQTTEVVVGKLAANSGLDLGWHAPILAIALIGACYGLSSFGCAFIPRRPPEHPGPVLSIPAQLQEFAASARTLWRDEAGRRSIILTSLLWGIGTTLRFAILAWTASALHAGLDTAAQLTAAVMCGIGAGAAWAGGRVPLAHAFGVVKYGSLMGLAVLAMVWVKDWSSGLPLLLAVGALGGYQVVPMNAVLQDRGHRLIGSGHCIALQNLGENLSILLMLGAYALLIHVEPPVSVTIGLLGALIIGISAYFGSQKSPHTADY